MRKEKGEKIDEPQNRLIVIKKRINDYSGYALMKFGID